MFRFLELPFEIRLMIYRSLRTTRSLRISIPGDPRPTASLGYASYGFLPQILATNQQISHEAKQVFYGENFWTLYAGQEFYITSVMFQLPPLASALPYIRKVFIRFRLFDWLLQQSQVHYKSESGNIVANIKEICKILQGASSLQSVKIVWTETANFWHPLLLGSYTNLDWTQPSGKLVDKISWTIWDIIKLFKVLPPAAEIQKGEIMVHWAYQERSTTMEAAFGNAVGTVIAHRAISKATKSTGTRK